MKAVNAACGHKETDIRHLAVRVEPCISGVRLDAYRRVLAASFNTAPNAATPGFRNAAAMLKRI
jgi:hypothetical protein